MKAAIIIPARYESTRFPGKPLALINGRPLIEWTWRAAMQCSLPVFVATDDQRIALVAAIRLMIGLTAGSSAATSATSCFTSTPRVNW